MSALFRARYSTTSRCLYLSAKCIGVHSTAFRDTNWSPDSRKILIIGKLPAAAAKCEAAKPCLFCCEMDSACEQIF